MMPFVRVFLSHRTLRAAWGAVFVSAWLTTVSHAADTDAREVGLYFMQVNSGQQLEVADLAAKSSTKRLTFINYAFANIYRRGDQFECAMQDRAEPAETGDLGLNAGTGGFADADYVRVPPRRITGDSQTPVGNVAGHFAELMALKQQLPHLRVLISIGGWNWSRWFSAASATEASRRHLVASCIDLFMRGNLPESKGKGGAASIAGLFDGVDIDWEYPGGGQPYNTRAEDDRDRFTLLLAEFRKQLDALGQANRRRYVLTAAVGVTPQLVEQLSPDRFSRYLDWVNLMSYDLNGAWDANGPTNFHANLFAAPGHFSIDGAVKHLLAAGTPAEKLVLGIPFYGRGWAGVSPGRTGDGLLQSAKGPAPGESEPGVATFKTLSSKPGKRFYDPLSRQLWLYDGDNFWSYDDTSVIAAKLDYVRRLGLRGVMAWAAHGDDDAGSLVEAMTQLTRP